jgi:hypothetical protein
MACGDEERQKTALSLSGLKHTIHKTAHPINHLKPNGNYMYHLFQQSINLHFVFTGFVGFSF